MVLFRFLLGFGLACAPLALVAQTPPAPFTLEIQAFADADAKAMPAPGGVLFLGSSSIRMWPALAADFPVVPVINRGFGGSQIADSVRYAARIVLPYQPKTIVFYAGDNDIEDGKAPAQVLRDFRAFVAKVRPELPTTRILFVSIKPSIARWSRMAQAREANRLIRAYAATDKRLGFIDIVPAMLGSDGKPRPELYLGDGLHMTRAGYEIWRKAIAPYLR